MDNSTEIAAGMPHPHIPSRSRTYGATSPGFPASESRGDPSVSTKDRCHLGTLTAEDHSSPKVSAEALEAAVDTWGNTVLRLAVSRLGNLPDAEDVFQNVFLKLFQSDTCFRDRDHLKAWLLRVTVNCCNDVHRSSWRKHRTDLNDTIAATLAVPTEPGGKSCDEELAYALAQLGDKQRTVVHLFYFEGYTTEEIAHITGERPATVRSHLHRARKTLRNELGAHL
ncbi:MAG: sigma-70 family RNA polymerase sigma factor [Gordonibacter sp.]|nr:sigma-70 family RNA polymerase sigma factor [Gordonibacter sp.]